MIVKQLFIGADRHTRCGYCSIHTDSLRVPRSLLSNVVCPYLPINTLSLSLSIVAFMGCKDFTYAQQLLVTAKSMLGEILSGMIGIAIL